MEGVKIMDNNDGKDIIRVVRAVIERDGQILAARRSSRQSLPLKWEFPGGKIKQGENVIDGIKREIKEELDVDIKITHTLPLHIHSHENRTFELIPFVCSITNGKVKCIEHEELTLGMPERLADLDWAEADRRIFSMYMEYLSSGA
jgi:8-oxo-dGTP diphosphatase